jgi:plastocyanin
MIRPSLVLALLLAVVVAAPTAARAQAVGRIEGRVQLRERPARRTPNRYPGGAGAARPVQTLPTVVYLEGAIPGAVPAGAKTAIMAQRDTAFAPGAVVIPVGGSVVFPNEDPFFHNVFSYAKPRSFDLGRYPAGESHRVVFDKPGIVPVFCEIHYSMRAYIHVLETPYFDVSDESRRFEIADVAPGEYVLHVWQENLPEIVLPVVVGDDPVRLQVR